MSAAINHDQGLGDRKGRQVKVAVIGAGIAGLSVANGLLNDPMNKFDVRVYERDTIAFDSERGGYQLRISKGGLDALRSVSDRGLWTAISQVWAGDAARAPSLVDPKHFDVYLRLSRLKLYPTSRPLPRHGLRRALLQPLLAQGRVHLSHQLTHFEYLPAGGVQLHFKNESSSYYADILIAADGSNSQVNRQVGLNNKIKLEEWTLIQSRGTIDSAARDRLPRSLIEEESVLFLGGCKSSGFASIYDGHADPGASEDSKTYTLFWSIQVPSSYGKRMLQEGNNEPAKVLPLLQDYLRDGLGYGNTLPMVMEAATEHFRTGQLTSSVRPETNWRDADAAPCNARVILLGDAVHPMTPGRGMGANQALTDAGELVKLLRAARFEKDVPSDAELAALVRAFEDEMYPRAFEMVKASEVVTNVDLTTWKGRATLAAVGAVMTVLGWGASLLEMAGLKQREKIDFMAYQP